MRISRREVDGAICRRPEERREPNRRASGGAHVVAHAEARERERQQLVYELALLIALGDVHGVSRRTLDGANAMMVLVLVRVSGTTFARLLAALCVGLVVLVAMSAVVMLGIIIMFVLAAVGSTTAILACGCCCDHRGRCQLLFHTAQPLGDIRLHAHPREQFQQRTRDTLQRACAGTTFGAKTEAGVEAALEGGLLANVTARGVTERLEAPLEVRGLRHTITIVVGEPIVVVHPGLIEASTWQAVTRRASRQQVGQATRRVERGYYLLLWARYRQPRLHGSPRPIIARNGNRAMPTQHSACRAALLLLAAILHPLLVAADDNATAPASSPPYVDYAGALRTFVDIWLGAAAQSVRTETSATILPPWPGWKSVPDPNQTMLEIPMKPVHHPWSGCVVDIRRTTLREQTVCFPSHKFLTELLLEQQSRAGYRKEPGFVCPNRPELTCYEPSLPPGALIVEFGPFLGESTVGLGQALLQTKLNATIVSVDTWHERLAHSGPFQKRVTWEPPPAALEAASAHPERLASAGGSLLFAQYLINVHSTWDTAIEGEGAKAAVLPVPLLDTAEVQARAAALGDTGVRPRLVFINPPHRVERLQKDMMQGWRLLACGGTLAGSGYHLHRNEIDSFRMRLEPNQPQLEASSWHAPGAIRWEKKVPYSDEDMHKNAKSNFSTWAFRGKVCS